MPKVSIEKGIKEKKKSKSGKVTAALDIYNELEKTKESIIDDKAKKNINELNELMGFTTESSTDNTSLISDVENEKVSKVISNKILASSSSQSDDDKVSSYLYSCSTGEKKANCTIPYIKGVKTENYEPCKHPVYERKGSDFKKVNPGITGKKAIIYTYGTYDISFSENEKNILKSAGIEKTTVIDRECGKKKKIIFSETESNWDYLDDCDSDHSCESSKYEYSTIIFAIIFIIVIFIILGFICYSFYGNSNEPNIVSNVINEECAATKTVSWD